MSITGLRRRIPYFSIFTRIAIGNAVIIVIGAVAGTLLTHRLSHQSESLGLIIFFSVVGTTLSILTNTWIVWKGLQPMHALRSLVNRVSGGKGRIDPQALAAVDEDVGQIAAALDSIVRQLEDRNRQLSALSERSLHIQEEERMRIARSLHDDTGQALSSIIIALERLENRLPENPDELRQRLSAARQLAASTLKELRKIIFDLRPSILDDLGLVPAIRWYARTYLEPQNILVQLHLPDDSFHLPPEITITLFRISQEAINNILRHAQARSVSIHLSQAGETVCLQVQDDGQGMDVLSLSEQGPHPQKLGLLGIRERVQLVGGTLEIQSTPGSGTCLEVCLPCLNNGRSLR